VYLGLSLGGLLRLRGGELVGHCGFVGFGGVVVVVVVLWSGELGEDEGAAEGVYIFKLGMEERRRERAKAPWALL
jgi:hypothetical protein